jgi:type VI secretion system secreted protein Hcp
MAVDIFLDLKDVDGESKDHEFKDKIDVISWSWGYSSPAWHGQRTRQLSVNDLVFKKYIDIATARLSKRCWEGKLIEEGTLICRKAGGASALDYLKIKFEKVLVTGCAMTGERVNEQFVENITLNFQKVAISYYEQDKSGAKSKKVESELNISAK